MGVKITDEKLETSRTSSPPSDEKDVGYATTHEHTLDAYPDPDPGLSDEERAAVVSANSA